MMKSRCVPNMWMQSSKRCLREGESIMGSVVDLTGSKFGRLLVVKAHPTHSRDGSIRFVCQCDCGNRITLTSADLRIHHKRSCGCQKAINNLKPTPLGLTDKQLDTLL